MANDEKRKLYQRMVQQLNERNVLQRMRVHGFWPRKEPLPTDPPEEVEERQQIEAEIQQLRQVHTKLKNPEKALAEERKRRYEESKQRRAERKAQQAKQAEERRLAWRQVTSRTIIHAGEEVSAGLHQSQSDVGKLIERDLPVLHTSADLAVLMKVPIATLKWLTYHRRATTLLHYHRYQINKKTGGVRHISAPKPALAAAQHWVLDNILSRVPVETPAHGFVPGRSMVSNARPHLGKPLVLNLDLQDFFPSITYRRVKGVFHKLGYSEHVATVLALLCTEPPRVEVELDGKLSHVTLGERVLPQGACTSPALTNLLCRRLDRRLCRLSERLGLTYTRYADDLTFSGTPPDKLGVFLRYVRQVIDEEGFTEHPRKTRLMRQGRRQEVTGVIVNERPTVSRKEVRTLRAILHNALRDGLASQNRDGHPRFAEHIQGRIAFVCMVDPQRGQPLKEAWQRLLAAEGKTSA